MKCANSPSSNASRIVQCVNACAGIDDPATALQQARKALRLGADCAGPDEARVFIEALRALGEYK